MATADDTTYVPTTREYRVFQKHFHRLHYLLGEVVTSVAIKCFAAELISEVTLDKVLSENLCVNVKSYHLMKGMLNCIVSKPDNFKKLISILESDLTLATIAAEMKQDFHSSERDTRMTHGELPLITKHHITIDRVTYEEYCRMRGRLGELVFEVKQAAQSVNVDVQELKDYLIFKNILNKDVVHEIESSTNLSEVFKIVCSKLCSPINLSILVDITNRFRLPPDVITSIQAFEETKKLFHLKLTSADFAKNLVALTEHNPAETITMKLNILPQEKELTVVEFETIINEVFSDLAHYIYPLQVKTGCVCVTLYAPKPVIGALIVMARKRISYLHDIGVILLIIGEVTIIDNVEKSSNNWFTRIIRLPQFYINNRSFASGYYRNDLSDETLH
jgi:hypothetical protein